ncbi:ETEC_3214 domain-containing protein [Streptomyces sp. NPDC056656]|uniref:ETEC_3214 domain-containing protein n=1 Tax=Streptomyces sp. NPDC056656 TaxID=3345895 RepID=UPI003680A4F4
MQWLPTVDTKLNVWTTAAIIVACVGLYNTVRGWWRNTLGKRGAFVRNFRKLAPHVRHEYVKSLFGEPAWQFKRILQEHTIDAETGDLELFDKEMTVRTWPLGRMAYLTTWCTEDDEVEMYGITTRSSIFRPIVRIGTEHVVRLGKSRLSSLPAPLPDVEGPSLWAVGAQRYSYSESHYFGSPGGYRTWVVGVSDAGLPAMPPVRLGANPDECDDPAELERYRAQARINSVLIVGGGALRLDSILPSGVGPEFGRVMLIEPEYGLRARLSTLRWKIHAAIPHLRSPRSRE